MLFENQIKYVEKSHVVHSVFCFGWSSTSSMFNQLEFNELKSRVEQIVELCDGKLVVLTRYFAAILAACDNKYNQHFVENALLFYTFVSYEIDALIYGYLPFEAQEKSFKGFISKQCGSFNRSTINISNVRLTSCCITNLNNEVLLPLTNSRNCIIQIVFCTGRF